MMAIDSRVSFDLSNSVISMAHAAAIGTTGWFNDVVTGPYDWWRRPELANIGAAGPFLPVLENRYEYPQRGQVTWRMSHKPVPLFTHIIPLAYCMLKLVKVRPTAYAASWFW